MTASSAAHRMPSGVASSGYSLAAMTVAFVASMHAQALKSPSTLIQPGFVDSPPASPAGVITHPENFASGDFWRPYLVPLVRQRPIRFSFAVGSGYDSAVDNTRGAGASFTLGEAAIIATLRRRSAAMVFTHDARFALYHRSTLGQEQFQQTGLDAAGYFSTRTKWLVQLSNGVGSDAARFLGSPSVSVSDSASPQPGANATLSPGIILAEFGSLRIEHRLTRQLTGAVQVNEVYHHLFALRTSGQQQSASLSLKRDISPTFDLSVAVEATRQTYASTECLTSSVKLLAMRTVSKRVRLLGSAGPTLSSAGCSGKYVANGLISADISRTTSLYAGVVRKPSDQFVAGSNWETSGFGGLAFGTRQKWENKVDVGYSTYVVAPTVPPLSPAGGSNVNGFSASGEARHRLSSDAGVSFTVRFLRQTTGNVPLNRTLFAANFFWSQEQPMHHLFAYGGRHGDL